MSIFSRYPNNSLRLTPQSLRKINSAWQVASDMFFDKQTSSIPPVINILSYSTNKLSNVSGKNSLILTFMADMNLSEWEVRADGNGVGSGDLIASGGQLSANKDCTVYANLLTWGDRIYRLNIYGKSTEGLWNSYE